MACRDLNLKISKHLEGSRGQWHVATYWLISQPYYGLSL